MWLADRHSDQELYTAAKHCAKIHLVQLHQTEEFLNLPLRLLMDILKGGQGCRQTQKLLEAVHFQLTIDSQYKQTKKPIQN